MDGGWDGMGQRKRRHRAGIPIPTYPGLAASLEFCFVTAGACHTAPGPGSKIAASLFAALLFQRPPASTSRAIFFCFVIMAAGLEDLRRRVQPIFFDADGNVMPAPDDDSEVGN